MHRSDAIVKMVDRNKQIVLSNCQAVKNIFQVQPSTACDVMSMKIDYHFDQSMKFLAWALKAHVTTGGTDCCICNSPSSGHFELVMANGGHTKASVPRAR